MFIRQTFKNANSIQIIEDALDKPVNCTYF